MVKDIAKIIDYEERIYRFGFGVKVSFHILSKGNKRYHCVIFPTSPFYKMSKQFRVNDFYTIKGEVIKSDNGDDILLNVYALELLRSEEAFLHQLKAETLKPLC